MVLESALVLELLDWLEPETELEVLNALELDLVLKLLVRLEEGPVVVVEIVHLDHESVGEVVVVGFSQSSHVAGGRALLILEDVSWVHTKRTTAMTYGPFVKTTGGMT